MNWEADELVRFLAALVPAAFFVWLFWAFTRRRRRAPAMVADEPENTPYRVYSKKFDQAVMGDTLPALLRGPSSDRARGWASSDNTLWELRVAAAEAVLQEGSPAGRAEQHLRDVVARHPDGWALSLLVDMSGSMKGDPITYVASHVKWLCDILHKNNLPVSLAGFSTLGWHGGRAMEAWQLAGRPKRPGRLCALLHVTFKTFDSSLAATDWRAMLHPDALRENVDGEALEWAAQSLRDRPEPKKLLIILSDGAPVDDATLTYNGPTYLERHLLSTIDAIVDEGTVLLGAIGVGFGVERYYPTAFAVEDLNDLAPALVDMIDQLLSMSERSPIALH